MEFDLNICVTNMDPACAPVSAKKTVRTIYPVTVRSKAHKNPNEIQGGRKRKLTDTQIVNEFDEPTLVKRLISENEQLRAHITRGEKVTI